MSFTFTNKLALERRADALDRREAFVIDRLDTLFSRKLTNRRKAKIERLQNRLEGIRTKQDDVADELTNYAGVTGIPDQYSFDGFTYDTRTTNSGWTFDWGEASISVIDTATDETFTAGDQLTIYVGGEKRFGGGSLTFKTLEGVTDGNVTTFEFGSSTLGEFAVKYDSLTFNVLDDNKNRVFTSEPVDVTNIV